MSSTVIGTFHPAWKRYEDILTHGTTCNFQPTNQYAWKTDPHGSLLVVSWRKPILMVEYPVSKCRAGSKAFQNADGSHSLKHKFATLQLICLRIYLSQSSLMMGKILSLLSRNPNDLNKFAQGVVTSTCVCVQLVWRIPRRHIPGSQRRFSTNKIFPHFQYVSVVHVWASCLVPL